MWHSVSIRHTDARSAHSASTLGKSEASTLRDLAPLLKLWPRQLEDRSIEGRKKLLAAIQRALREERRRGRAGHGAYNLERHATLCRFFKQERASLAALHLRDLNKRPAARSEAGR